MNSLNRLHCEIIDFCTYMAPTPKEDEMRMSVVEEVREVILSRWTNAKVEIYGSFSTGFHLPTSDIDLVMMGDWIKPPLHELQEELLTAHICDVDNIQVIDKASVPIVKFTHMKTSVKVDISFNCENGLKSIDLIKQYSRTYPPLKKLVIVLKQFLLERKLNEVFYGGISSYSLILLVISFLQLHNHIDTRYETCNLAILLIEFFELYGCQFNYLKTAIRIKGEGTYISKDKVKTDFPPSILCIEDPLNPGIDIGRGCYGVMNVKQAFEQAYIMLNQISNPLTSVLYMHRKSILGKIISAMDNGILDQRKQLHQIYYFTHQPQIYHDPIHNVIYTTTTTTNSDTISSPGNSDSDCENQNEANVYTPPLISNAMPPQPQLKETNINTIHLMPNNNHNVPNALLLQQQQLKENTLLQNNPQLQSKSDNQHKDQPKDKVIPTQITNSNIVQAKENIQQVVPSMQQPVNQLKNKNQKENIVHNNNTIPTQSLLPQKLYHTMPQYRFHNTDYSNYMPRNNNKYNLHILDDIRLHHYHNNNNKIKFFPATSTSNIIQYETDTMQAQPQPHHHNSMPFIHNSNSNQIHSIIIENTNRTNNINYSNHKKNNSNANYHKKAHSFHSS